MKEGPTNAKEPRAHESPDMAMASAQSQDLSMCLRHHLPVAEALAAHRHPRALPDHSQHPGCRAHRASQLPAALPPLPSLQVTLLSSQLPSLFNSSHAYYLQFPPYCPLPPKHTH